MVKTPAGDDIPFHPALVKFAADGYPDVVALTGYLGPSPRDGYVTLYRDLRSLGKSLEVQLSDIVHVEDTPESVLPFGAKTVWVRKDTDLALRTTTVRRAEATEPDRGFVESTVGRLRMRRRDVAAQADCTSWCQYLCRSHCEYSAHCDLTCEIPMLPGPT
jgi:hypothetical protein